MQYPAYSFSQGKHTGPAPHKGTAGGRCGLAWGGGGRAQRAQSRGRRARRAPRPLLWFGWPGDRRAPRPQNAAAPPGRRDFPFPPRDPLLLPLHKSPYPKSLLETSRRLVSKGRAIRSPWRAAPCSLRILREAHAPSALHFRSATSQGSGGGAAPSRGPGARPPLAMRSQCHVRPGGLLPAGTYFSALLCTQKRPGICRAFYLFLLTTR